MTGMNKPPEGVCRKTGLQPAAGVGSRSKEQQARHGLAGRVRLAKEWVRPLGLTVK